jgi:hypothetical protein
MATYSEEDLKRIAKTIGKDPSEVTKHANRFEAAATWYRLNSTAPKGKKFSETRKRMTRNH